MKKRKKFIRTTALLLIEFCYTHSLGYPLRFILRIIPCLRCILVSKSLSIAGYIALNRNENDYIEYVGDEPRLLCYAKACYEYKKEPLRYVEKPASFIAVLHQVIVIAASNLILTSDGYGLNDMVSEDMTGRIDFTSQAIQKVTKSGLIISILYENQPVVSLEKGILLSAHFSYNYYHFTLEILPRFMHLDEKVPLSVPLLIDSNMVKYSQFSELLNIFNRSGRQVIVMDVNRRYCIGKLYYPNIASYIIPNLHRLSDACLTDCLYDPQTLEFLRNTLLSQKLESAYPKRVFLYRKGGVRLFNQEEVFAVLEPLGFKKVTTEDLSVGQQAALFHQAEVIVGGSGAAFTNLIYCHPFCKVFLLSNAEYPNTTIYPTLAKWAGADLWIISTGESLKNITDFIHKDFYIDPQVVLERIKKFN